MLQEMEHGVLRLMSLILAEMKWNLLLNLPVYKSLTLLFMYL